MGDGVGNHDGMVFVLTTNFKDQLDDALIRDGRVDIRVHFDYCTPDQMKRLFDNFYPPKASTTSDNAAAGGEAAEAVPDGAAFRDALLVALGSHRVSAAQLQSFFVTHRKCTAAEAIADVDSIVTAIKKRAEEEAPKESQEPSQEADGKKQEKPPVLQGQSSA